MKKITAFAITVLMLLSMSVSTLAAQTVSHSLAVNGESSVSVKTGDVITVTYTMQGSDAEVRVTQNEIFYDGGFFQLVSGSVSASAAEFNCSAQVKSGGQHYVYFNTMSQRTVAQSGLEVGSFRLKVIGKSGSSVVTSTECRAFDATGKELNAVCHDLTVQIEGTAEKPVYSVQYAAGVGGSVSGSVESGTLVEEGTAVTLTATANRSYHFTMWSDGDTNAERSIKVGKAISLTASFALEGGTAGGGGGTAAVAPAAVVTDPAEKFTDLKSDAWYSAGVRFCMDRGIMRGTGENTFSPDADTTRATIVTILYRLEGEPLARGKRFPDVAQKTWYTDAVAWASANGIVGGYDSGLFGPDDAITREQIAAILCRYAKYKGIDTSASAGLSAFSDADSTSSYARGAMQWAVGTGLLQGSDGMLFARGSASRAQVATIFQRFCA